MIGARSSTGNGTAIAVRARQRMIEHLRKLGVRDERVLTAIAAVPRHQFVDEALASRAYEDTALPLGFGQTISQPFVVARMLEVLAAKDRPLGKTLEIGTGCGYQAAVLAQLATEVYSLERIGKLLEKAKANLRTLRLPNLRLKHADGQLGVPDYAPFDSIILAAAGSVVPQDLVQQLAPGGRMVMPRVQGNGQVMVLIERLPDGTVKESSLEAVKFVPLLGGVE